MDVESKCPTCGSTNLIGVQYQGTSQDYDGVSEWRCVQCGPRFGRWSNRVLGEIEIEGRYGRNTSILESQRQP